jgi:hypothetical protein
VNRNSRKGIFRRGVTTSMARALLIVYETSLHSVGPTLRTCEGIE